jgi:WD40 repeat protein
MLQHRLHARHVAHVLVLALLCCAVLWCPAGGDDHTAKVWDLRQRTALYTLPAHTSLISTVRYQPGSGHVLLTAGFDRQVNLP